ncbi:chromate efflux transporter [Primorskyibacter sp. S187A]|uniref:chromate efflux transporter n=1 Tax=Primorskyibacter sp. S187A TaxID=3415130 RepID=UPI003C7BF763
MQRTPPATLRELIGVFGKIGLLSFGGPAAQIALLQREIVHERKWLEDDQFLKGLGFCMMLPGPEAMQLATYAGWTQRGIIGGGIAGGLFLLPGACVIAGLCALYIVYGTNPEVQGAFLGIKAAVLAIVLQAVWRLSRRALSRRSDIVLAVLAFLMLTSLDVPFPLVIASAAVWGLLHRASSTPSNPVKADLSNALKTLAIWGGLSLLPLVVFWLAGHDMLFELARFFGQLALTSFGGAYAALAYMTQTVVTTQGWLSADQMIDALGLAETTPGPLILVTQFVGHLAGYGAGGWMLWATAGITALWMTFMPCFLWIFLGAPYLDVLMSRPRLASALRSITAAVVGVMASLALWFGLNVLFDTLIRTGIGPATLLWPQLSSISLPALACLGISSALLWLRGWPVPMVLLLSALLATALGWRLA